MVINKSGITIRIAVDTLRVMGRATQGVKIIRLKDDDSIASVAKVSKWEAAEEVLLDEDGNVIEPVVSESTDDVDETNNNQTPDEDEKN